MCLSTRITYSNRDFGRILATVARTSALNPFVARRRQASLRALVALVFPSKLYVDHPATFLGFGQAAFGQEGLTRALSTVAHDLAAPDRPSIWNS